MRPDPGYVGPGQGGVDVGAHEAAEAAAFGVGGGRGGGGRGGGFEALVGFALAGYGGVDCDDEGGEGRVQGAEGAEDGGGGGTVLVHVELEGEGVGGVGLGCGIVDGGDGVGGIV